MDCKDRLEKDILKKDEISHIKEVVSLTEDYEDIVFYLKVCIRFGQVEEAMKFVNSQTNNENFTKDEQDKMRKLKEKIQELKKKYMAVRILKKEEGVEKAVQSSGLLEVDVLRLNRKLLEKEQENKRKKEENDDGEEPNI